ncbi:ORFL124C, partial [Human betaherpesvirus 5]
IISAGSVSCVAGSTLGMSSSL